MESTHVRKTTVLVLAATPRASRFWRITLVLLSCAVSYLALAPHPEQQPVSLGWDKLNHLLAFVALAAVGALGFVGAWGRLALGLLAFGVLIEVLQGFTPSRSADWNDLLADALGIALGFALAHALLRMAARLAAPK